MLGARPLGGAFLLCLLALAVVSVVATQSHAAPAPMLCTLCPQHCEIYNPTPCLDLCGDQLVQKTCNYSGCVYCL
jgi:hypothetical protein